MSNNLAGEIAVVTGGSSGMGQAICWRLAEEGARIAILDKSEPVQTVEGLRKLGADVFFEQTDVSSLTQINQAFALLDEDWGAPTVLANVAGVYESVPFLETSQEVWDRALNVNARGLFFCAQAAAKRMARRGGGRIVNILSTAAQQGFALGSAYCASKGAALLVTRTLAIELAEYAIIVNGVAPGTVRTPMAAPYLDDETLAQSELARTPLGRFGEPSEVAETVAFLATKASWITGEVIYVDGGFMATGSSGPVPARVA